MLKISGCLVVDCDADVRAGEVIVVGEACQLTTAVHLKSGTAPAFRIGDPMLVGGAAIHQATFACWYLNGADRNDQRQRTATILPSHALVHSQFQCSRRQSACHHHLAMQCP